MTDKDSKSSNNSKVPPAIAKAAGVAVREPSPVDLSQGTDPDEMDDPTYARSITTSPMEIPPGMVSSAPSALDVMRMGISPTSAPGAPGASMDAGTTPSPASPTTPSSNADALRVATDVDSPPVSFQAPKPSGFWGFVSGKPQVQYNDDGTIANVEGSGKNAKIKTPFAQKLAGIMRLAGGFGAAAESAAGTPAEREQGAQYPFNVARLGIEQQDLALRRQQLANQARYQNALMENMSSVPVPGPNGETIMIPRKNLATYEASRVRESGVDARTKMTALGKGIIYDDQLGSFRPMTQNEIAQAPMLQKQYELEDARQQEASAQQALAAAHRDVLMNPNNPTFAQKERQIQAQLAMAQQRINIAEQGLALRGNADQRAEEKLDTPSAQAQKAMMEIRPVKQQVMDLYNKLADYVKAHPEDANKNGFLLPARVKYAMGIHDASSDLASDISQIELNRVLEAGRVMRGTSRAYQALEKGMIHTPNTWVDSPAMMMSKLRNVYNNLSDQEKDAIAFGTARNYLNGNLPGEGPASPTPLQPGGAGGTSGPGAPRTPRSGAGGNSNPNVRVYQGHTYTRTGPGKPWTLQEQQQ